MEEDRGEITVATRSVAAAVAVIIALCIFAAVYPSWYFQGQLERERIDKATYAGQVNELREQVRTLDPGAVPVVPPAPETGPAGSSGQRGEQGSAGLTVIGPIGPMGPQGPPGQSVQGPAGESVQGAKGDPGVGKDGVDGVDGAPGKDGADGAPGADGSTGPPGPECPPGYTPTDQPAPLPATGTWRVCVKNP